MVVVVIQLLSHVQDSFCDPMDYNPPGSPVHGIFQTRILEWVASSFLGGIFLTQGSNLCLCTACVFFTTEPPGKPYRERCLVLSCFESVERKLQQCKYTTELSSSLFLHCFCIISSFLLPPGTLTYNHSFKQNPHAEVSFISISSSGFFLYYTSITLPSSLIHIFLNISKASQTQHVIINLGSYLTSCSSRRNAMASHSVYSIVHLHKSETQMLPLSPSTQYPNF